MGEIEIKQQIYKVLSAINTWWQSGSVDKEFLREYKRFAFYEANNRLHDNSIRRAVILSGARRTGKTTIEYQIINELLERGIKPQQIVFLPIDQPVLKTAGIQMVLEVYHETIYADKDCYYFFDEITKEKGWEDLLKSLYDLQPKTKVFATGSASTMIEKGSTESGVGRFTTIRIPTMSFYEYCAMLGFDKNIVLPNDISPSAFFNMTKQEQSVVMLKLQPLQNHFNRYLLLGGFPELAIGRNDTRVGQTIREDIIDKVLKRDIPDLYRIRNTNDLEKIFLYICNVTGDIVSIETMCKELSGVSRPTAEDYIKYLVSGNLVYQSMPLELGSKAVLKASPKLYVADTALRLAVLMESPFENAEVMGKLAETTVYKHLYSFYSVRGAKVGYFRGGDKSKEIDIVVEKPNKEKLLIEAKYRNQAKLLNTDALAEFGKQKYKAFLMTKRAEDFGVQDNILRIPAFAFLYLIGLCENANKGDI